MQSIATSQQLQIRPATASDLQPLAEIWLEMMTDHESRDARFALAPAAAALWQDQAEELLYKDDAFVLAAEARDGLQGFCVGWVAKNPVIYRLPEVGFISEIAVRRRAKRHGIGRALVDAARTWFRQRRLTELQLSTAVWNDEARAFWQTLGGHPLLVRYHFDLTTTGG